MRTGLFVEAYTITQDLAKKVQEPTAETVNSTECFVYFEYILVAKKILYKQYFYQRALDLLLNALKTLVTIDQDYLSDDLRAKCVL